ncbi:SERTA domain-containing protein 3 isoform 2-T4 [Anableps anableps]
MILKGQKRKLDLEDVEVSDPSSPTWESQRQFVFSVSLNKYQRGQELPEPSLRRSVLIANTLRQITLEKCGVSTADGEEAPPLSDSLLRLQETAISSILTALDSTIEGSSQAAPRTPLRSLENLSGLSERSSAWVKHGSRAGGGGWQQQGEEEVQQGSAENGVPMEDLLQDVDPSLLERATGGLGIQSSRVGYPAEEELICYLPPFSPSSSSHSFSLSLNSNLRCLPSFSSFSPPSSSPSPESAAFSGQNQTRDGFELEHLMEILVES